MTDQPKFDWRTIGVCMATVIGSSLIQWGVITSQITEHSRRIELLERIQVEKAVDRVEYEKRHEDLKDQIKELREQESEDRKEIRDLERGRR